MRIFALNFQSKISPCDFISSFVYIYLNNVLKGIDKMGIKNYDLKIYKKGGIPLQLCEEKLHSREMLHGGFFHAVISYAKENFNLELQSIQYEDLLIIIKATKNLIGCLYLYDNYKGEERKYKIAMNHFLQEIEERLNNNQIKERTTLNLLFQGIINRYS